MNARVARLPALRASIALTLGAFAFPVAATAGDLAPLASYLASQRQLGRGAVFQPPPLTSAAAHAVAVDGMRCTAPRRAIYALHLELFAADHVVLVPAGIGIAPPQRRQGAYVRSGRCFYPAWTEEPTGLILVGSTRDGARSRSLALGDLFAIWGQPLSASRLAGFRAGSRATVRAYVNGRRWRGSVPRIPLRTHEQIVLEVGPYVPPHTSYAFPAGL